jgi:predicted phage baseplate assembly protein
MNDMTNPPGQPVLRRRIRVHGESLAAMRDDLGASTRPLTLRALARQETTDPALALLDSWAVVCDVVAFYSERIATEGYLRTATERGSVRELARTLGYELRPGVAAQVELAFHVETAPGAPAVAQVPRGTPAQSIPGQGELPQTFETSDDLEARGVWNALPGAAVRRQGLGYGTTSVWLAGPTTTVRAGDSVLIVGAERLAYGRLRGAGDAGGVGAPGSGQDREKWDFRTVQAVVAAPPGYPEWTRLDLDRPVGYRRSLPLVATEDVRVYALTERTQLFGATAADPGLLVNTRTGIPPGIENVGTATDPVYRWIGYAAVDGSAPDRIELDGDRMGVLSDSWMVLDQPGLTETYRVEDARPDGASKFGLSGRLTRVRVDVAANLAGFDRRQAMVHCTSVELPARWEPLQEAVSPGATLQLVACDPLLPVGRLLLVHGVDPVTGAEVSEVTRVVSCVLADVTGSVRGPGAPPAPGMTVSVDPPLACDYVPATLVVHANVTSATHGETVNQVLGSGDGRTPFRRFALRRSPLTSVRARTPSGAQPELEVRVDGVRWQQVESLADSGPQDRVYVVRQDDAPGTDPSTQVVQGDGVHGARAATGAENITATYRVGIGTPGAVTAGQVSLLVRRPLGIRDVVNPAPSHDMAPPETLEDARRNAPQRVRTLDRVVSVADYADFARGYAGVGAARSEIVWNGTASSVVLSVLHVGGDAPSRDLLRDLRQSVDDARDPGQTLVILPGQVTWFGVRVDLQHDPAYVRADVEAAVRAALEARLGAGVRDFAEPVTAAGVLVLVHDVAGVRACTMPRLLPLGDTPGPLPDDRYATDLLVALGARWDGADFAAQLLALSPGAVEIGAAQIGTAGPGVTT